MNYKITYLGFGKVERTVYQFAANEIEARSKFLYAHAGVSDEDILSVTPENVSAPVFNPVTYRPSTGKPYSGTVSAEIQEETCKVREAAHSSLRPDKSPLLFAVYPALFKHDISQSAVASFPGRITHRALSAIADERGWSFTSIDSITVERDGKKTVQKTPYVSRAISPEGQIYIIMVRTHDTNNGSMRGYLETISQLKAENPGAKVMLVPNEYNDAPKQGFTNTLQEVFQMFTGDKDAFFHFLDDVRSA